MWVTGPVIRTANRGSISIWIVPPGMCTLMSSSQSPSLWATPAAAQDLIEKERPVVDFADVYLRSVERFLDQQVRAE